MRILGKERQCPKIDCQWNLKSFKLSTKLNENYKIMQKNLLLIIIYETDDTKTCMLISCSISNPSTGIVKWQMIAFK